jgi:hypothetical protein
MSAFDAVAARLEAAIFAFDGDSAVYQPRIGAPRPCQVIVDKGVEVFDSLDVGATIYRDEAEFLNSEGRPVKGETFQVGSEVWHVGQLLKKTRETTRVIVLPG